jgi:hypothetical protein
MFWPAPKIACLRSPAAPDFVKRFRRLVPTKSGPAADEIISGELRTQPCRRNDQFRNDIIFALPRQTPETGSEHHHHIDIASKEILMRKLFFSIGAIAAAVTTVFIWSQTMATPTRAGQVSSISVAELMANYTGPLPAEQWDAF